MIRSKLSSLASVGLLSVVVVALGGSLVACGGAAPAAGSPVGAAPAAPAAPATPAKPAVAAKEPGEAKVGDATKCTVSGEEMTVEATSPKSEYQGKTYFFCCSGCKKKFDADPAKYAKKS